MFYLNYNERVMKNILKKFLPSWIRQLILAIKKIVDQVLPPVFKSSQFLASIYYAIISNQFWREHHAVLAGKVAYRQSLKEIGETSILLRRNIHRIEKGLIMQPRRDVFAEKFINETVKFYERAIKQGNLNCEEKKWFTDVLTLYFTIVKNTDIISIARIKFLSCVERDDKSQKFTPYQFDALPKSDINYRQLNKLFVKRRSVRWYQDEKVPMELIEKALNLAALAPSACNRQPYMFYVSENKQKAIEIAKCAGGTNGWAEGIPCMIAIIGDLSAYPDEKDRHLIYIDSSLAAMQLMLALETLGLSSCAINWADVGGAEQKMKKLLGLKPFERTIMLLSVGYAQDKGGIPYSHKKNLNLIIRKV
jgi:nitroreductase